MPLEEFFPRWYTDEEEEGDKLMEKAYAAFGIVGGPLEPRG